MTELKKTRIAYCSDLHMDNYRFRGEYVYPLITIGADILILAGDLCEYKYLHAHMDYIKTLAEQFKYVLIVEGNHEFYEWDINQGPPLKYPDNVILLKDEKFVYNNIVFFGGPLWSKLDDLSDLDRYNIRSMISDFSIIKDGDSRFSIERMGKLYNSYIEGLYETHLELKDDQKLVAISHFAPSLKSVSPGYEGSSLNPYFCNDLDELIKGLNISHFIHGHVHSDHDYMIGNTRILCNPRGYPREKHSMFQIKEFEI